MTPTLTDVAERVAALVRDEAVPALGAHYAAGQLLRGALLLQAASEAFEHGAAWRVAEIRALQALMNSQDRAMLELMGQLKAPATEPRA